MPRFKLHAVPSSPQSPSRPRSETTRLKEPNKKSVFRKFKISSISRAFLSRSSPTPSSSRSIHYRPPTPPLLRRLSDTLAKMYPMSPVRPKTLPSTRAPIFNKSATTVKRRRTYHTTGRSLRGLKSVDCPEGIATGNFDVIPDGVPNSLSDARLRLRRAASHNGQDSKRLSFSESTSFSFVPFPKMDPPSPDEVPSESSFDFDDEMPEQHEARSSPLRLGSVRKPDCPPDSQFLHVARFLQQAARDARNQDACSQKAIFQASAPLILFAFILCVGVLLPRYYTTLQIKFGSDLQKVFLLVFFGGALSVLFLLRGIIWVLGVLGKTFCEVDLMTASRQGECIAVDGTRMGEAQLVLGTFLFG